MSQGLTLIGNYTQEKEYFEAYLDWTLKQNALLQVEDTDTNALEASIYQKKLLIGKIREQQQEAQWLSKSIQAGPEEETLRRDIRTLLEQIQPLEQENLALAEARKNYFGSHLKKMREEHQAARGYNNVGFYAEPGIFDEKK